MIKTSQHQSYDKIRSGLEKGKTIEIIFNRSVNHEVLQHDIYRRII